MIAVTMATRFNKQFLRAINVWFLIYDDISCCHSNIMMEQVLIFYFKTRADMGGKDPELMFLQQYLWNQHLSWVLTTISNYPCNSTAAIHLITYILTGWVCCQNCYHSNYKKMILYYHAQFWLMTFFVDIFLIHPFTDRPDGVVSIYICFLNSNMWYKRGADWPTWPYIALTGGSLESYLSRYPLKIAPMRRKHVEKHISVLICTSFL